MREEIIDGVEYEVYDTYEDAENAAIEMSRQIIDDEISDNDDQTSRTLERYYNFFGDDIIKEDEVEAVCIEVALEEDNIPEYLYEKIEFLDSCGLDIFTDESFFDLDKIAEMCVEQDGIEILDYGYGWEEKDDGEVWIKKE